MGGWDTQPPTLLFTQDEQERFARETSSGCLVANECMLQMGVETLPFGGVGASGMGVYHGQVGW